MSSLILPQSDHQAGIGQIDDNGMAGTRSRASLACESCRMLKIRCISDENSDILSCENCDRLGKDCVFVPRVRTRRRKRADARVTDLEKEVRALTSLLRQSEIGKHMRERHAVPSESTPDLDSDLQMPGAAGGTFPISALPPGLIPTHSNLASLSGEFDRTAYGSTLISPFSTSLTTLEQPNKSDSRLPRFVASNTVIDVDQQDVIDRGVLSWEATLHLFKRYQQQLTPCYPIVPLADTTNPAVLRREKPTLFLATIAAAAAVSSEQLRNVLHDEILEIYANCVMIKGIKSLELLQAMLITVAWYRPCNSFNDTKYLQYSQAASLMAHELGLGKPVKKTSVQNERWTDFSHGLSTSQIDDRLPAKTQIFHTESTECHRTLIASYVQSSTKHVMSHVPTVSPTAAQVTASLQVLESSPNLSDFDRDLTAWARLQLLTQEARRSFGGDDSEYKVRIADAHVHLLLAAFEKQLRTVLSNRMSSGVNACLQITFNANILHLNEIALYEDYDRQDFRPPYSLDYGSTKVGFEIGAPYINAIMKCICSSHELLDTLLAMYQCSLGSTPAIIFVRMAYAAVVLFKIFLLVTTADHPLAAVLDAEQLQLPAYLDALHTCLSNLSHNLSFHGANKFLNIIMRLEHSYKCHQASLPPDHRRMTDTVNLANARALNSTFVVPNSHINRYGVAQHYDAVLPTPGMSVPGTHEPSLHTTLGEQFMDEGSLEELSDVQAFPFTLQGPGGFMPNSWAPSLSWEPVVPDYYHGTIS